MNGIFISESIWQDTEEKLLSVLDELSIEPNIPQKLPFKLNNIETYIDSIGGGNKNFIEVIFLEDNHKVIFRANTLQNAIDYTNETEIIENELKGTYGEQGGSRILKWKNNGIYYELFCKVNSISRTEMIQTAASAEQLE